MPGPPRPDTPAEIARRALEAAERVEADHWSIYGALHRLEERVSRLEHAGQDTPREQFVSNHDLRDAAEEGAKIALDKAEQTGRHNIPLIVVTPSERVREIVKNERARTIVTVLGKVAIPVAVALSIVVAALVIRDCQRGNVPSPTMPG
jgi:hypothetical protein